METSMFVVGIVIGCILGLTIGLAFWGDAYDRVANDQELLSGTTWQGGECVIILNK